MRPAIAFPRPLAGGCGSPPCPPLGRPAPCLSVLNGLQTHSANAARLPITGTVSSWGDGTGLCSAGSGSALLMRSCLLLSHQYFAVMCIPDAADRLWLSSETQINSNRAISPSLGISACGRICLHSLAWLGARAVPGNGLAMLSGFYGTRSGGGQRAAGRRRKSCFATVRLRIHEPHSSCASQAVAKGALPHARDKSHCPYVTLQREPLCSCLHTPNPASGTVLVSGWTPCTPLHCHAPLGGHSAAWPAMPLPCAVGFIRSWPRAGRCGQDRGWGQEPSASPPAVGAGCLFRGGGGGQEVTGGWGQLHPVTLPPSLLAGAARASCT